ncbi:sigma-54-dependent transcriptional regulator [Peptoclostridium litorale]|nr:sigma-54 dependent transcriptional regulator [Peptoclostridium litorale]
MKILVVDDEIDYRETFKMLLEGRNFTVETAESADVALEKMHNEYFPLVLSDVIMPGTDGIDFLIKAKSEILKPFEIILVTGYGNIQTAISAIKNGAFGFFIKSHNPEELIIEIEKARRSVEMKNKLSMYEKQSGDESYLSTSKNLKMNRVIELAKTVACSDSNVLITGESGVGKEIIAKLIHENSTRADMPFVAINCQSFSDNIIESELFGHEKGAFTGAFGKRIGRFEEASGGTIFMDEIGELSQSTQVKMLRVLENRSVERIGSNKSISVNFRLISATNRSITPGIQDFFREDLFYRINTIELNIPPLRKRKEDIEDLIFFFLNCFNKSTKKNISSISPSTMEFLKGYDYPGNIRELKNIIERLVVTSKGGILNMDYSDSFDSKIKSDNSFSKDCGSIDSFIFEGDNIISYSDAKKNFERYYFEKVMEKFDGNITKAADFINLSRRQLFNKITEFGLK